ncbi:MULTISPECIES: MerR family transcriptional regulator [Deinococcus]|uniref:MerR family transcriptional regulator n=1 Tax=Deinococcus rufus TaxID=2136097 RepID=A0ABV7ZDD0_9DEIO|nr:MerR family transcriptional regulator [Deinococcus sp. AB2017081]WQE96955.1 MerR family DNA-binding transcriptional regulator [Deinococcus sp. AB2017081]
MNAPPEPLLSIGQFARQVGLSVSALRFYAQTGLLLPAHVDPDSGYRYYSASQVAAGQQIAALRQLEVPLDDLAEVMGAGKVHAASLLARHEQRLYDRFQVQRQLLRRVGDLIDGHRALPEVVVDYATWPAQHVLSLPNSASAAGFDGMYTSAVARLRALVPVGEVAGQDFGLYHAGEYLGGPLQVEVCLPVAGPQSVPAPIRLLHLPVTPVASTIHTGDWTTYNLTFAALHAAVGAAGHSMHGSFTRGHRAGMELGLLLG